MFNTYDKQLSGSPHMMAQTDKRTKVRSSTERRKHDRRVVDHTFGSAEWIKHMQKNYIAWPKTDRRQKNRRQIERRVEVAEYNESLLHNTAYDYTSELLTPEEQLYFDELFKDDDNH